MKKLLALLIILCISLSFCVIASAAETPKITISASQSSVGAGDTVTFTVSISKVKDCTSVGIGLNFPTGAFEMVDGSYKLLASNTAQNSFVYNSIAGGYVANIQMDGASTVSGELFKFALKVKTDATVETKYTISGTPSLRVNYAAKDCTISACSVKISCSHKWDDGKVTKEATCSENGEKTYTCKSCGDKKTSSIDAKGHKYDDGKVTSNPTCTSEGAKTYTCKNCNKTKTESISAKGHSYDDGKVTQAPTCTAEGVKTYTCTTCGGSKTESVAATGHSYDNGTLTQDATCSAEGVVTYTCDTCGKTKTTEIDPLAHTYDNDCDTVCNVCSHERTIEHAYEWVSDGVMHWQACTVCGEKTESENCTFAEEMTTTDTQHGYLCAVCGHMDQAADHDFHNDCDTLCETCGYTRQTSHIYSEIWIGGADGHWHECTSCGDKLEIVPHTPGEEATETTDQNCLDCGYILQVAGNHQHSMAGDWLSDENGHWFLCFCGEYTEAEAHSWNEGVIKEEESLIHYTCITCGQTYEEEYIAPTTQPTTEPTETTAPSTEPTEAPEKDPMDLNIGLNLTTVLIGGLGILLLISIGFNIYLLCCLFASKKTGKYAMTEYTQPIPVTPIVITEVLDEEKVLQELQAELENSDEETEE